MQRKWLFAGIGLAAVVALAVGASLYYWLVLRNSAPPAPPAVVAPEGTVVSEYDPSQPLVLTFTEAMNRESLASALQVDPPVPFQLEWRDDRSVAVQFQSLDRENTYKVTVGTGAQGSNGLDLRDPVIITLRTAGNLAVSDVQPADGTEDVTLDAAITVVFNRPVVDLAGELDQRQLPQPLVITPAVAGSGEWLNTAIYRFTPTAYAPLTSYTVAVDSALVDVTGTGLAGPYRWTFTTVAPYVLTYSPQTTAAEGESVQYARPTDPVRIDFAQPMDQASVEAALRVRTDSQSGADIEGRVRWAGNSLIFTPSQPWQRGAVVSVYLSAAKAEGGAELPALDWTFDVIQRLRLVATEPANDSSYVYPGMAVRLQFSAPIDLTSLEANVTIDPKPSYVYTYWDSDSSAYINFDQSAATTYTVTVGANLTDISGWRLGQDVSFAFTTGDWEPSFLLMDSWHPWAFGPGDEPKAYASYRNISRLDFALYSLSEDTFIRLAGDDWQFQQDFRPGDQDAIRTWSEDTTAAQNAWGTMVSPLSADAGALPTGLYYLVVTAPEFPNPEVWQMSRQIILVTGQNLTVKWSRGQAMAWVTGWDDGKPRSGAAVRFLDADGQEVVSGTAGTDGVVLETIPDQEAWRTYFAFAGAAGDDTYAVAATSWSDGINPWRYDVSTSGYSSPYAIYLYTDRDIYRPGQTVYFKGIVRYDQDARYTVPSDLPPLTLTCTDAQGQEILNQKVTLNEMGTFNGSLTLAEGAPLGYYNLWMPMEEDKGYGFGASFQVAEYRRPEYEIGVVTDHADYVQGDNVGVTANASYYFGGAVSDAAVRWTVLTQDYYFNWQGDGYYDFTDYDYLMERQYFGPYGEAVAQGDGKTDSAGRFTFTFPADISEVPVSQQYTIEVVVTDVNNQEVSSRTSVVVHKGAFYVGIRPQTYVAVAGDTAGVDVLTVDSQSQPVADRKVLLTYYEHRWYNVREKVDGAYQWSTSVEDLPVATQEVTTDAEGKAQGAFVPENPGTYKVVAIATDDQGREIRSSTYLWVTGQGYVSWAMQQDYTVQLITDKKSYNVGDTAKVLIPSPYQGSVAALLTSERGQVLDYRVMDIASSSQVVEIPITEEYAPNVYFVAVLMRGADEDASLPPFQVGYASAAVATDALEISLDVQPDRSAPYQPGEQAVFNITARDAAGNPVQAEMSLNLVDKSVLALADSTQQSLVDYFYSQRSLSVQTALTMAISTEALDQSIPSQGKGGGGGGGEPGGVVRENFPETAFWDPTLMTDANGKATVAITLPDNLTTWRLQAKAVTSDTLVAEEDVEIVATKELLLTPILPRFLVVGDKAMVGAVVHNNTKESLTAQVSLAAEGLTTQAEPQTVTLAAGDRTTVTWEVTAVNVADASITVSATAGQYDDAVKQSLPVYAMTAAEVVATSGQVAAGETRVEGVAVPPRYSEGELSVEVDASLAASMIPGLSYLEHYPYECVEQTLSRFLPNVVTSRALRELGIEDVSLTQNLAEQVTVGLQKLYGNQHTDGGWGWWFADESSPFLSAYVVYGLAQARDAGYSVDGGVFDRAVAFLTDSLHRRTTADGAKPLSDDDRAYIIYVLAEAGEGDLGASVKVYEGRVDLSNRGRAYLLMALAILSPQEQSRLDTLVSELKATAVVAATSTYWQDAAEWQTMGTDVVTTAVVAQAFSRVAPSDALLPGAVRWLMTERQDGHWSSTYETATTIMSLTDYMVARGELQASYAWNVAVNGRSRASGTYSADNLTEQQTLQIAVADLLRDQSNSISFSRKAAGDGTDSGQMYYSMSLRYYPPAEELRAVNGGIIVEREYRAVADSRQRVSAAAANDMVEVRLTIVAPNDLYHVVVEDPFPAGCEGVDTSLRTTTVVGVQPQETSKDEPWGWWWFSHSEIRDDKAVLFATYLPKGTYEYTYYIRASVPGEYNVRPAAAYQMYYPDVYGHSAGSSFTVTAATQ